MQVKAAGGAHSNPNTASNTTATGIQKEIAPMLSKLFTNG